MKSRRVLMVFAVLVALFSLLACYSTACMTNDELVYWLDTGTPVPCFSE